MPRAERLLGPLLLAAAAASAAPGCAAIDRKMLGVEDTHVMELGQAEQKNVFERALDKTIFRKKETAPYMRPTVPPEAQAAYDGAKRLYDGGKYKEAEKAGKAVAKKYRDTILEEDALYLTAQAQFAQRNYAAAQDGYDELFERFPSTRHSDDATKNLFEIARYWLQFPEVVTAGDVQPVNFEKPSSSPLPPPKPTPFDVTRTIPFLPNVADKTRPAFDTEGRALQALKSIWLNDPTGPLADDALMLSASHHLRKGDYLEADRFYQILREEYPKSPHLEDAFVLGSHVKLMSYQGSGYDGKALEDARQLKADTLKLFPKTAARDRLIDELQQTEEAEAARRWDVVRFYQRKGNKRAIAVSIHALLSDHPNSRYASQGRVMYAGLPQEAKAHLPPLPGAPGRVVQQPDLQPVPYDAPGMPPSAPGADEDPGSETGDPFYPPNGVPDSRADPPSGRVRL